MEQLEEPHPIVPPPLANAAALGWRVLAIAGAMALVIGIGMVMSSASASIIVGALVSAAFAPIAAAERARGRSPSRAAGITFLAILGVAAGIVLLLAIAFLPYLADLARSLTDAANELDDTLAATPVPPEVSGVAVGAVADVGSAVAELLAPITDDLGALVTIIVIGGSLSYFLLADADRAWRWAEQWMEPWQRERMTAAVSDIAVRIGGYLRRISLISAIDATALGAALAIAGASVALPVAVLALFLGLIPFLGTILAAGAALSIGWHTAGATGALLVVAAVVGAKVVERIVVPSIVKTRSLTVPPTLFVLALATGLALGGIVGLVAAIPVVGVIATLVPALIDTLTIPAAQDRGIVPGWLDRSAQWSWRLLVVSAVIALAVLLVETIPIVVLPLTLAIIFAATLEPLVDLLVRRSWRRSTAAVIATSLSLIVIVTILTLATVSVARNLAEIATTATSGAERVATAAGPIADGLPAVVADGQSTIVRSAAPVARDAFGLAFAIGVGALLCLLALRDGPDIWRAATLRVPPGRRAGVRAAGSRAIEVLGGYMLGTAAISGIGAASQWLMMVLLGLPLALPLGILSFFAGFIPYVGSFIGTALAFLVTIQVGTTRDVVIMAVFTVIINLVQGSFITPIVYSRVVAIHAAVVLVAIPAANEVAGVLGMFLVVPVIGVVAVTWRSALRVLAGGIGSDPTGPLADPASTATALEIAPGSDRDALPDPASP
jgi:putative heme transporter